MSSFKIGLRVWCKFEIHLSQSAMCGTHLSGVDRYFCFSKRFSRPMSCSSVNTVRLRRPFLLLPPPSVPCSSFPRRCRSSGRWWEAAPICRPGAGDSSGEPSEQDSGEMGNLRRLPWSAFSTGSKKTRKNLAGVTKGGFRGSFKASCKGLGDTCETWRRGKKASYLFKTDRTCRENGLYCFFFFTYYFIDSLWLIGKYELATFANWNIFATLSCLHQGVETVWWHLGLQDPETSDLKNKNKKKQFHKRFINAVS